MASGKEFPLAIVIRTVDKATPGLRAMDASLSKFSQSMDNIGKVSAKVGKSLTKSLTLPLVGIGIASVKAMSDFQDGMAKVGTLVDTSVESVDEMGKAVREMGKRTPVALDDLTLGLYNVRSAGVSAADGMNVLEMSAQLGVAGLSTTAEAVDIVTSSMNAFGLKGKAAAGISDVLFTAVKHGKTNLSQLGVGFGAVAGKMADAGISFDEYIASVSAMTTVGLPASQAHTQMRAAVDGLTKSSKPLSKIFHKLGAESFQDLIQKSGGVVPAMMKVREAVGGSEAKMRALIGSSEGSAAVMSVTGTTYKAFTETLADMRDGVSEVDKKFGEMNSTSAASWKRTKNSLTSVAISIGTILAPVLEGLSEKLQAATKWWDELDAGTKVMIVDFAKVVAVVGPGLMVLGKLVSTISMIATVTRTLSAATWVATGAMKAFALANPWTAFAIAAVAAAALIYTHWDGIKEYIEGIIRGIKEAVDTVKDVKAYLTGDQTSADKSRENARNTKIMYKFNQDKIEHKQRGQAKITADSDAKWEALMESKGMGKPALGPDGGASLAAATAGVGKSQIEVNIKGAPKGTRVNTTSSDKMVDLSVGNQTSGLD